MWAKEKMLEPTMFSKGSFVSVENMWAKEKMLATTVFSRVPLSGSFTLSQTTNFILFQIEFADKNFKFDKNGRDFAERVENTVGKREIAC